MENNLLNDKIKKIWIISLILLVFISLLLSLYIYNTPLENEKICVKASEELRKNQKFPNKVEISEVYIKDNLIAIQYSYVTDTGSSASQKELWKYDNKNVEFLGNDDSIKVQDLPIGYLSMTSKTEEIIADIINSESSIKLNAKRINRFSRR